MKELIIRFVIGGLVVSALSLISDLFKPKTFAGLFGAAPSVALASLGLTALTQNQQVAATEARSMLLGAAALLVYAPILGYVLLRFRLAALPVAFSGLVLWLGVATALWYAVLVRSK